MTRLILRETMEEERSDGVLAYSWTQVMSTAEHLFLFLLWLAASCSSLCDPQLPHTLILPGSTKPPPTYSTSDKRL